jgi:hypothetical protein
MAMVPTNTLFAALTRVDAGEFGPSITFMSVVAPRSMLVEDARSIARKPRAALPGTQFGIRGFSSNAGASKRRRPRHVPPFGNVLLAFAPE